MTDISEPDKSLKVKINTFPLPRMTTSEIQRYRG